MKTCLPSQNLTFSPFNNVTRSKTHYLYYNEGTIDGVDRGGNYGYKITRTS